VPSTVPSPGPSLQPSMAPSDSVPSTVSVAAGSPLATFVCYGLIVVFKFVFPCCCRYCHLLCCAMVLLMLTPVHSPPPILVTGLHSKHCHCLLCCAAALPMRCAAALPMLTAPLAVRWLIVPLDFLFLLSFVAAAVTGQCTA